MRHSNENILSSTPRFQTGIPTNKNIYNDLETDPIIRIANVIEDTMIALKDASGINNSLRIVNRLTAAKKLPNFSGEPLKWRQFKQSYEISSELREFTDKENILRLFEAPAQRKYVVPL